MEIIEFEKQYNKPIALCLGFFDCIHIGHMSLIRKCCDYSEKNGINAALLTFTNDPKGILNGSKQIYSFKERCLALENCGMKNVIAAEFNSDFSSLSPSEFLNKLYQNYKIRAIFVGKDYTFGKFASGNVDMLRRFCDEHSIELFVVPFELDRFSFKKVSTSDLKSLVAKGDFEILNGYLSEPYFMIGKVERARHVGSEIGFPTANIRADAERLLPAGGIYATKIIVDGKSYDSMTNVGGKPTFDIDSISVETNIFDFSEDIYEKEVKLIFFKRTRGVKKFDCAEDLAEQLKSDRKLIGEYLRGIK